MAEAGDILGEKYRLDEHIGAGGMATVWRATNMALDRPVAVKFISSFSVNQRERFLREAKVAASIRHRNVVDILDFGVTEQGEAYMVLEYMHGESLADRMARPPALNLGEIVNVAVLTLSGLSAAHNAGVVHRDIKPENVFLVEDDDGWYPKLLDFGVSKQQAGAKDERGAPLTQEGMLVGTPQYMAPEQARGLKDVDARADLWSMGVMLYELLTGDLPFDSENIGDVLLAVMSKEVLPVADLRPEVGPELSAVVGKAMERDREKRFQTAKEMRAAILEAAAKMGDAAGMWGRITPGQSGVHEEQMTPISGLIQIAAVEAARASVAAAERQRVESGEEPVSHADALAQTITAARSSFPSAAQTTPIVREARTATPVPTLSGEDEPRPKQGHGAVWVFVLVALLGVGAAGAYVWDPELFAGLLGGEITPDGGSGDVDASPDDDAAALGAAPDLGHGEDEVDEGSAEAEDSGEPAGIDDGGSTGDEVGVDDDAGDEGDDDAGHGKRRWIKRRWVKRHVVKRRPH